jgi:rhamnosyl/mannosyltransferase
MRILEVTGDPPGYTGGMGRTVSILAHGLREMGHDVTCLSPRLRVGELKFSTIGLRDLESYDIVHSHGPTPFLSDVLGVNPTIRHLVLTYHANVEWVSHSVSQFYLWIHNIVQRRAEAVVVESDEYRRLLADVGFHPEVIRLPFTIARRENGGGRSAQDPFTVLYVSQLRAFKGIRLFLMAAKICPKISWVIAGGGYLESGVRDAAARLPNVTFLGTVPENQLPQLYARAHVICLPSINTTEAYGLSLLEGSAFGAVPVATDLPGVRENIGILGGFTFRRGDFRALSEIVRDLECDRSRWDRMSATATENARTYGRQFTPHRYVAEHEALFRRLAC